MPSVPPGPIQDAIDAAVAALRWDEVVVVPTDTVYGLAVRMSAAAVERLFELKGRAADKPFAVLVGSREQADALAADDPVARRLMDRFWPGPLTIVTRRADGIDFDLGGDPRTIGIRHPQSELIAALAGAVGPLVTTSANRAGEPFLVSLGEIASTFGAEVTTVIDGGELTGEPSMVVDCSVTPLEVLRGGPIDEAEVRAAANGLA